ncbi:DUF4124 domain-containing protein [Undibacterium rugosum]|uniref:DUF4124 domain-containing protein n=1 Tax=Undibacterium rugosum TaxID=2762291 RepID=A0A923I7J3_9BURK|nr:DUF4124 domain-containing protein [Undibacterium rugosum]MBC3937076.1 DUF4124 domain-containing protein [Undibacterium rugosum]MBR7779687.1 DUF4124 domain-containing protein [Undibacterium rugosum]
MKRLLIGLISTIAFQGLAFAQTEVFLCVDENGKKEYKNTGATKGCKKVELPGITMVPAPVLPPTPKKAQAKSASSPADFPKVDEGTQKSRDADRKQILSDELKAEEQKLADLKKEFNNGEPERRGDERNYAKYLERTAMMKDNIARTEKNVEALRREIANLK